MVAIYAMKPRAKLPKPFAPDVLFLESNKLLGFMKDVGQALVE